MSRVLGDVAVFPLRIVEPEVSGHGLGYLPKKIVHAEQCGMVIDSLSASAFKEAVLKLKGDGRLRETLGRNGRTIAPRFSVGSIRNDGSRFLTWRYEL